MVWSYSSVFFERSAMTRLYAPNPCRAPTDDEVRLSTLDAKRSCASVAFLAASLFCFVASLVMAN